MSQRRVGVRVHSDIVAREGFHEGSVLSGLSIRVKHGSGPRSKGDVVRGEPLHSMRRRHLAEPLLDAGRA
jgi:hypothetical protein